MTMVLGSSSASLLITTNTKTITNLRPIFHNIIFKQFHCNVIVSAKPMKKVQQQKLSSSVAFSSSSSFEVEVVNEEEKDNEFIVVNFYRFVHIENPNELVALHLSFLQGFDIHGRIYVNEQGINAQYSGPSRDALLYLDWLKKDRRFLDILVQISPASNGHAFPRLKLRYKPSLVQLEGGISHLPLLNPLMRAVPLAPSQWRKRLQSEAEVHGPSSDPNRNYILLDVRNGYEWDIGHFHGAQRPDVDCFRSTSFGQSESELAGTDPLTCIDKENTDILMYCTGGIRCDIYSAILREQGFRNLYTLKGGVSHYLEKEGPVEWIGSLFVFDSRLSLPPSTYKPEAIGKAGVNQVVFDNKSFARCFTCGSAVIQLRHRNCANLDCNLLYLCCTICVTELRGCCCLDCTSAPRLRPIQPQHDRYEKWHVYRDQKLQSSSIV